MIKSYKYRLIPTDEQKATLNSWMEACRFVFNLGLETKNTAWSSAKVNLSGFDLMRQLTDLKKTEATWLSECPSQALESALTNLDAAFSSFFKNGAGFPNFKKRRNRQSVTTVVFNINISDLSISSSSSNSANLFFWRAIDPSSLSMVTRTSSLVFVSYFSCKVCNKG